MDEKSLREAIKLIASRGGKKAAKNMTPAERSARAKMAAAASAKVRSKKAREKRKVTMASKRRAK